MEKEIQVNWCETFDVDIGYAGVFGEEWRHD